MTGGVAREHEGIVGELLRGVPDLLVEVVSPSHPLNDRLAKRALYARNGVAEYWIAEPDDGAVQVLRLDGAAYVPAGYFGPASTLTSATQPGLAFSVEDVFGG